MAIIDLNLREIELTFAPKLVLFGSANETIENPDEESRRQSTSAWNESTADSGPNVPGIVLFVLGIAIAIWLGRQRIADRTES